MPLFDVEPVVLVTKRKLVTWLTEDRANTEESVLRQVAIGGHVRSGTRPVASVLVEVKSKNDQVVRGQPTDARSCHRWSAQHDLPLWPSDSRT